jgi:DNA repair protein SbcD/Mre11
MKFLHTSDWHLGRQFHNISLIEDQEFVLEQIINHIIQENVSAILISGDIYDRAIPPVSAVNLLNSFLERICFEIKIPVIMISGNHDSLERINFASKMMKNSGLHIISDLNSITDSIIIDGVNFYGIPYSDPDIVNDLFGAEVKTHHEAMNYLVDKIYSNMNRGSKNILLSHCFINGCSSSESERQLSVGGADLVGVEIFNDFDYVALGHLHAPQSKGEERFRYSGSILKYSFSEISHNKSVTIVEIDNEKTKIKELPLKPKFDLEIIEDNFDIILEKAKKHPFKDNYFLIRIRDERAILDPMNKLREYLPNVLQIEKIILKNDNEVAKYKSSEKRSELDMFKDFYFEVSGNTLDEIEEKIILNTIKEVNLKGENKI